MSGSTPIKGQRARVAVLASGRGTNFAALASAAADTAYPAQLVRLICNRPEAGAFAVAHRFGVPATLIDHRGYTSREEHEQAIVEVLDADEPDLIVLAGYMRVLTAAFVARYPGRILNIHPSILPLFPGTHTHERVLEAGMTVHGATVHFVTADLDAGPIIAQAVIAVLPSDTPDTLPQRLLPVENRLYPLALELVASGKVRQVGGKAERVAVKADEGPALFSPPSGRP